MDTPIVVALIAGGFGSIGAIANIAEKVTSNRSGEAKKELDRGAQVSEDIRWYVENLKADKVKADKALTQCQDLLQDALYRLESQAEEIKELKAGR